MTAPKIPKCNVPNIPELKEFDKCLANPRRWFLKQKKLGKISSSDFDYDDYCSEAYDNAAAALRRRHYKLLGSGAFRDAYAIGKDCVLKIATNDEGDTEDSADSNIREARAWNKLKHTPAKRWFIPILHASPNGAYVLVPRVVPLSKAREQGLSTWDFIDHLERKLDEIGADCDDIHSGNVGIWGNRPVVIDYGFGVSCRIRRPNKTKLSWGS